MVCALSRLSTTLVKLKGRTDHGVWRYLKEAAQVHPADSQDEDEDNDGTEEELDLAFGVLRGIYEEYHDDGDQLENCDCSISLGGRGK